MCVGPEISKTAYLGFYSTSSTFENRSKMLKLKKKLVYLCRCKSEISLELNNVRSLSSDQENHESPCKGPVKLIKRVKIAHSFLQSLSDQFHVILLSLPM